MSGWRSRRAGGLRSPGWPSPKPSTAAPGRPFAGGSSAHRTRSLPPTALRRESRAQQRGFGRVDQDGDEPYRWLALSAPRVGQGVLDHPDDNRYPWVPPVGRPTSLRNPTLVFGVPTSRSERVLPPGGPYLAPARSRQVDRSTAPQWLVVLPSEKGRRRPASGALGWSVGGCSLSRCRR